MVSVISVSGSDAYFASSDYIFNFSFTCLVICCCVWKLYMLHWVTGTEVNRILVWSFILIWLEVVLCLMFAVPIGPRSFKFLYCLFLKSSLSALDFLSLQSIQGFYSMVKRGGGNSGRIWKSLGLVDIELGAKRSQSS